MIEAIAATAYEAFVMSAPILLIMLLVMVAATVISHARDDWRNLMSDD